MKRTALIFYALTPYVTFALFYFCYWGTLQASTMYSLTYVWISQIAMGIWFGISMYVTCCADIESKIKRWITLINTILIFLIYVLTLLQPISIVWWMVLKNQSSYHLCMIIVWGLVTIQTWRHCNTDTKTYLDE